MTKVLIAILVLLSAWRAEAQTGDWILSQRDKDAIGRIEVRIGPTGFASAIDDNPELGTGVIISDRGHVLTAAHLFSAEDYKVCARLVDADPDLQCTIQFLRRGDPNKRFELKLASSLVPDRDYIVLKLPDARDAIGEASWPQAIMARGVLAHQPIHTAGYTGTEPSRPGGENAVAVAPGNLREDSAADCAEATGLSRNATGLTSPGWSGGPVFNSQHRLVGIHLGKACPGNILGDPRDAPLQRVLLLGDMTGLCSNPGFDCFYGFQGDIDPPQPDAITPWYKRLVDGEATADSFTYGWKMRELAKESDYTPICFQTANDTELIERVQADRDKGSQLAAIFGFCLPSSSPQAFAASKARLERLAEDQYAPAQFMAASFTLQEMSSKLSGRMSPSDPLGLSAFETERVRLAERHFRAAAAQGWPSAAFQLFSFCTSRVFTCQPGEAAKHLEYALTEGSRDALRVEAIATLIGEGEDVVARYGFARPRNAQRALALLRQNASPQAGASRNPSIFRYDGQSAAFMAYFSLGGRYRGEKLVQPNLGQAVQYIQQCNSGLPQPLSWDLCGLINGIGNFNLSSDRVAKIGWWSTIQQFPAGAFLAGPLVQNLKTWSSDGKEIDEISCDLNETLQFAPPPTPPAIRPGVAYCYFRRP